MQGSERAAVAEAVEAGAGALVVVGGADIRHHAADVAERAARSVIEVRLAVPLPPWAGIGVVVDALRQRSSVRVAPALEAARGGMPVGDHLGLGSELRALLAGLVDDGPTTLLVRDAHRLDLSSAGALSHALGGASSALRVVVTQAPGGRGVHGLTTLVAGGDGCGPEDVPPVGDPTVAPLDSAWAAAQAGDHLAAARWWLAGGRPDLASAAVERAPGGPASAEVVARLAHLTSSARVWSVAIDAAVADLAPITPLPAVRLLLLDAAARANRGDAAAAHERLSACVPLLDRAADEREHRPVADLHALVTAAAEVGRGAAPTLLLERLERPLARLAAGVDPDAVRLLASAAMPLGWVGNLTEARALLDRLIGVLHGRRRYLPLPQPLATSAWLARRRAHVEVAARDGARAIALGRAAGATNDVRFAVVEVAHVEALQGRLDACRAHVADLVGEAVPRGAAQVGVVSALAVGELLAHRPEAAIAVLEPVHASVGGTLPPAHTAWRHNLAEAYVRTGRTDDARAILGELEAWSARSGSPREHGQVAWCRGMVAPAGRHDEHFRRARTLLEPYPALRWRAEVAHLRRLLEDGRHDEADDLADRLAAEAPRVGMPAGVDHVRRLRAQHGAAPAARSAATATLGIDDLRLALALVEGADDDEIAARLHLTRRRVEEATSRVLAALGVETTGELGAVLPIEGSEPGAAAEVRILGPTVVARGSRHTVPPAGRPATVLALVASERSVTVDRVLDVLWPDADPSRTRPRLRNVLARLRAAVGPVVGRDGELLVLDRHVVVDAHRFWALADRALEAPPDDVEAHAADALATWTGTPLLTWPYDDWAEEARRRLVGRCVAVLARRAEVRAARGAVAAALDDLEHALVLEPDEPELWVRAVELAERDGRVGRARSLRRRAEDRGVELG